MAGYLSTQFQDYGGGELANALDFVGWNQKRKSNEQMLKNQQLNEQMALEDLMTTQQKRPLELERSRLDNEGLAALLPEKRVKGQQAERDWEVEQGIPVEQRQQAMRMKLAREMTEDDLKTTQAAIERGMVHESPAVRKQASMLRMLMTDMVKMREGFENKELLADKRAVMEREKQGAIGARAVATASARAGDKAGLDSMQDQINKKRTATEKLAQIRVFLGALAPDDPKRMALMRQEAELLPMVNMETRARTAGKQIFNAETGKLESPSGITLEPRQGAAKPDPLGIR